MTVRSEGDLAIASGMLAVLNDQADDVRAELARLKQQLDDTRREINGERGSQLLEANEQLVAAALRAHAIADTAARTIAQLVKFNQRDPLTHTPNRALTLERLENAIATARRHGACLAVLFVDIDQLKAINDAMGHAAGDAALRLAARRLESVVRDTDTVSRHCGDEYLVLLTDISQANDAAAIAAKMLAVLATPSEIGSDVVGLSASIGIAVYPQDGQTANELIAAADAAMHGVKRRGGGGFAFRDATRQPDPQPQWAPDRAPARPLVDPVDHASPLDNLREANERLVLAALTAHELKTLAEEAHGRQIKFMAMVAHELRNPLTPIRMAAGMLNMPGADEARMTRLQDIIETQVTHMVRLVDDLLDGSRISTGKLRLTLGTVDIGAMLSMAAETCLPAINSRAQQFVAELPATAVLVQGDAVRLAQVFSNLLDNASKYTQRGGRIGLSLVQHDGTATITVSDNGIGITADALPHIFDLFVQDHDALVLHSGGLGIGLAVARELVEAHGGTVSGSSMGRQQGSIFVVILPVAPQT